MNSRLATENARYIMKLTRLYSVFINMEYIEQERYDIITRALEQGAIDSGGELIGYHDVNDGRHYVFTEAVRRML